MSSMKKIVFSFKTKVLLSYLLIIFVPMMALSSVTYYRISNGYKQQIQYAADQAFEQTVEYLESKINTIIRASDIIYLNPSVQEVLRRDRNDIEGNHTQQYQDSLLLNQMLSWMKSNEDVYGIKLYVHEWLRYSAQTDNYGRLEAFWESPYYERLESFRGKAMWLPPREIVKEDNNYETVSAVSMLRQINDSENLREHHGVMEIYILQEQLDNIVQRAGITQNGLVFIQNTRNEIITTSSDEKLLEFQKINFINRRDVKWQSYQVNEEQYVVRMEKIDNTDWELITIIPIAAFTRQATQVRNLMLFLLFFIGIVAFGLAYFFSNSFTNRIHGLTENMIKVQNGHLDVYVKDQRKDEIGQLNRSFNYMVQRLKILLETQYKNGQEIKSAELKALQAQINPHFLYNTLDLINWKAIDKNVPEIGKISRTLAKFYKLSLNKGKDIVTVKDEIDHVKQYVTIQNMRFENRIDFFDQVPKVFYEYQIPKIIFQPLVENSIMHGILKRKKQSGIITLSGTIEKGDLIFVIKDDGIGMEEITIKQILYSYGTKESHGYGVKNIHERLKLNYGEDYGLSYESIMDKGTTVRIRIPARK